MWWIPEKEVKLMKEYNKQLEEQSKRLDWGFKALLQLKAEKGDFNNLEPIIRHRIMKLAYGK